MQLVCQYPNPLYPLPQHWPCLRPSSVGALATISATVSGLVSPRVSGRMHMPITPATTAVVPNIKSGTSAANAAGTCSTSIRAQRAHQLAAALARICRSSSTQWHAFASSYYFAGHCRTRTGSRSPTLAANGASTLPIRADIEPRPNACNRSHVQASQFRFWIDLVSAFWSWRTHS